MVFSLLPVIILLVSVEIAARVLWNAPEPETGPGIILVPHPTRIWGLDPGSVIRAFGASARIGRDGLRRYRVTGAETRVLTLGDSSIFGHGLEDADTLHAQLQSELRERGVEADVLCGGIPGYSSEQTLALMEEQGWALEPDLLVIGNLWSDNNVEPFQDRAWMQQLSGGGQRAEQLMSYSRAWRWLRSRDAAETTLPVGWVRAPFPEGRRRVPLTEYAENLDALLRGAAERGIDVIFLAPCNRMRLAGTLAEFGWDPYLEAMRAVAARRGVPVVDALEVLQRSGATADAAFLDEMHPVGATNGAYAEALDAALDAAGWPAASLVPDPTPAPWSEALEDRWAE